MHIIATFVHKDEPAWGLYEQPALLPGPNGSRQWRWVQRVFVLRDDAIAKYETDFGPADDFNHVTPIILPSPDGVNTVGQLQELADKNRGDDYWHKRRLELLAESTLIRDHLDQLEMQKKFIKQHPATMKELIRART